MTTSEPVRTAVIGVGHLGKEHARILAALPQSKLVAVADVDRQRADMIARQCATQACDSHLDLLGRIDAAVVAVPTLSHFQVAGDLLGRGMAVLVEKPLAASVEEARAMVELSQQTGAVLQVGHIERFNPVIAALKQFSGTPKYIDCERLGPFSFRSTDIGVVFDVMIHDVDLVLGLVGSPVESVEAFGVSVFGQHEDIAKARLRFANGCIADLTASRCSVRASRCMRLWSAAGYISLDFGNRQATIIQPSQALRRRDVDFANVRREQIPELQKKLFSEFLTIEPIEVDLHEPLAKELESFLDCVVTGRRPVVGGDEALAAVETATMILQSLRSHGWNGDQGGPTGPLELPEP